MKSRFLYLLLLYCLCFEETLAYLNVPFSLVKYVVIFVLLIRLFTAKATINVKIDFAMKMLIVLELIALLRSVPMIFNTGFDGIMYWKNFLWFPIFLYIFSNLRNMSGMSYETYFRHYINAMCFYVVISTGLYFVHIPFLISVNERYWGRITVGYPTIDVIMISSALALLFFNKNGWNVKGMIIRAFCLILGIIATASGTGMALLCIVVVLMVIHNCGNMREDKNSLLKTRMTFIALLFVFLTGGITAISYFKNKNPQLYESVSLQMENRFNLLIGRSSVSELNVNTMEIREERYKKALTKFLNSDFKKLFGIGFGNISMKTFDSKHIIVEDQISLNRVTIGNLGNMVYIYVLLSLLVKILRSHMKRNQRFIFISMWMFMLASSFTSCNILSVGPIALWSLTYSYLCSLLFNYRVKMIIIKKLKTLYAGYKKNTILFSQSI